jgi:hypothetical protein
VGDKENPDQASAKSMDQSVDQPDASQNAGEHANGSGDANKKEPPKFDWVTHRSQCSLPKIFAKFRQDVEQDVKTRNGLRPANSPYEFSIEENGSDFSAVLKLNDVRASVTFSLAEHAILVHDDKSEMQFEVTIAFDDDGVCKVYVNQKELHMWQVRRMALEELMFRGY